MIIAGNHDSPDRLCAAKPLAERNGIILLGLPGSQAGIAAGPNGVKLIQSGQGWLELAVGGVTEHAVIITLPYPSESRLNEIVSESLDEEVMQQAYSERVGAIWNDLSGHFRPDTINLAMSHLFIMGGEGSDSERLIQLGGALTVEPRHLPETAHYIALGHLHKPQKAAGAKAPAFYSGSLLPYSFSEAGCRKAVLLIEAHSGLEAHVEKIELHSGKPLVKWVANNGLAEVIAWCEAQKDPDSWIDLELHVAAPLTQEEIRLIRGLREDIINIRPVLTAAATRETQPENRAGKPLPELFAGFYQARTGVHPRAELVDYFIDLANREKETQPGEGGAPLETA